jgi:hypothetical protein
MMVRAALRRVGTYFYIFPTFTSGRRILWDAIDIQGNRIMYKYIPEEIIESRNEQQMRIRLTNGSQILILGSDNYDTAIIGTNAVGMIFSEYALQDSMAWSLSIPILNASAGWALFVSTPRGKNHLWSLYNVAENNPNWFCQKLSLDDTCHVPVDEIRREIEEGQMSEDLVQQEFYCSFDLGVEGSFYSKHMDNLRLKSQITSVPWEPYFPVFTAWDLGFNDPTTIIFAQKIGQTIRIIDCYENTKKGLDHYAKIVKEKPYTYSKHLAPFDIAVHDLGTGISRWKTMHDLGITFIKYDTKQPSIEDGIEAVRRNLPKMWFDETNCKSLIKSLENYRQEFDVKRKIYKDNPLHDWSSHWCFTGDTKVLTRSGMRQIINIQDNEEILTANGWEKCLGAKNMRKNVKVIQVVFADGVKVRCTPDHLFLTEKGWISAQNLENGSMILSSKMMDHKDITIKDTNCMDKSIILEPMAQDCTVKFGLQPMEIFHQVVIFITKIVIPKITNFLTWFACLLKSTENYQSQTVKALVKRQEMLLSNGMVVMQEENGIVSMQKELKVGKNMSELKENVCSAEKKLCFCKGKTIPRSSVTQTAKHLMVERIEKVDGMHDVWCILVPNSGHFSLSNGAIVSNCDAMRYLCVGLPRVENTSNPEALERRYQEAMGHQSFPGIFSDDLPNY